MKKPINIDYLIGISVCIVGLCVGYLIWNEFNDFNGVTNLDKNRSRVDVWLLHGRTKDEVIIKFGAPSNSINDEVWIWLLNQPNSNNDAPLSIDKLDYRYDGFWIEFANTKTNGPLRSVSGNFEEWQKAISQ